jgi:methylenetetrahydrofolate dehydrogenase (NADP+)/methenyltetrahydrofolate cyclohydrolase
LANAIRAETAARTAELRARGMTPRLAAVCMGDDPSVQSYLEVKQRVAERLGITFGVVALPADASQAALHAKLAELSADPAVHGIVLELPLPSSINTDRAINAIAPGKDVDGLTPHNLGLALAGQEETALVSATAQACVALAETSGSLSGRRVALIGKGRTVGRACIAMLLNRGATVTFCHRSTRDLGAAIRDVEIVISAAGSPGILSPENVREGQIIIDAGTTMQDGRLLGDADPGIWGIAAAVTPVPEGVGPLTTAFIFRNLIKAVDLSLQ